MKKPKKRGRKKKKEEVEMTTQRVDVKTLSKIKTVNYHLYKSKDIRLSQWEIIKYAINYVMEVEADFIDYVESGRLEEKENTFDTLVRVTGKPWFPYGNLLKLD